MIKILTRKSGNPFRRTSGGDYDFGIYLIPEPESGAIRVAHWTSCRLGEWCPKCGEFHDPDSCDQEYITIPGSTAEVLPAE